MNSFSYTQYAVEEVEIVVRYHTRLHVHVV